MNDNIEDDGRITDTDDLQAQSMQSPTYFPEITGISLITFVDIHNNDVDCMVLGFVCNGQMVQFAFSDPDFSLNHYRKALDEFEQQLREKRKQSAN